MDKAKFNRTDLIQIFINNLKARVYLEIGVSKGHSFLKVKCNRKIGVDPEFRISGKKKIKHCIKDFRNIFNRYHEMTSDDFFTRHKHDLISLPPQVIFIDGLHTFEQTLKDCYNSLNFLSDGGVIVLHDCDPPTEASSTPALSIPEAKQKWNCKRSSPTDNSGWTEEWCGDTWKTIPYLINNHAELNVCVLNADYGLGIVSKKQEAEFTTYPPSIVDLSKFKQLNYAFLKQNRKELLNLKELSELSEIINLQNLSRHA